MRTLVVLPTYNEIFNIELMLRTLNEIVPECHVLVVDDGSPDGTAKRAHAVGSELGGVDVLERSAKAGLGDAYRAGFAWGLERGFDHFVEMDGDFSHDPKALPSLFVAAEELRPRDRLSLHRGRPHSQLALVASTALARWQRIRVARARSEGR